MDPSLVKFIVELVAGAVGGNLAGAASKNIDLGTLWNSVAGIIGGGIGGQVLAGILGTGAAGGGLDIGSIVQQVAGGGVGGAVVLVIVGLVKNAMAKSA